MSIISEEQKIIDLENEISFLKDALCEKQKEIEEKTTILLAGSKKVKQLEKEIEELKEKNTQLTNYLNDSYYVSVDKIKEKIDKYRKKIEKLHSQELWNEPEDSIKDFKYKHYLEAYKEILEDK